MALKIARQTVITPITQRNQLLKVSLRQFSSALEGDNPPTVTAGIRKAGENHHQQLRETLKLSTPEEIGIVLGKLRLACPSSGLTEDQNKVLMGTMIDDLEDIPAPILEMAGQEYRKENRKGFFPSTGELRERSKPIMAAAQKDFTLTHRVLEYKPPQAGLNPDEKKVVAAEMDRWQGYQDRRRALKKLGSQRTPTQAAEYKTLHVWANEDRRAWKQSRGNNWVPIWPELTTGES